MSEEETEDNQTETREEDLIEGYKEVPEVTTRSLKRIQFLAKEAQELKQDNERLRHNLNEREKALESYHNALAESERIKNKVYETTLAQEEERIVTELKSAKEFGDVDKEVLLTRDLVKIKTEQNSVENEPDQSYQYDRQQYQDSEQYNNYDNDDDEYYRYPLETQNETEQTEESEELMRFYHNLPQVDPESSFYDPEIRSIADKGAEVLIDIYKKDGRENEIGGHVFFNTLHAALSKQKKSYADTGVTRSGSTMADVYAEKSRNGSISLTPAQLRIARNLPGNMTEDKKIELYAKHLAEESKYKNSLYGE